MLDFEKINKLIGVISKPTPTLVVKHVIELTRNLGRDKTQVRGYAWEYANTHNIFNNGKNVPVTNAGLYFECLGYVVLESKRIDMDVQQANPNTVEKEYEKKKIVIYQKNVPTFLAALDNTYTWLTNEKDVFVLDVNGKPIKLVDISTRVNCPLSQSNYAAFKPCIIRDASDVRYEGIAMGNETGEITNFTAPEFAAFRAQMYNILNNLYFANNMIINQAMIYCTYKNMNEALGR